MLTGKAKTAYMREYMRRRRAGEKPKKKKTSGIASDTNGKQPVGGSSPDFRRTYIASLSKMDRGRRLTAVNDFAKKLMKAFPDLDITVYGNIDTVYVRGVSNGNRKQKKAALAWTDKRHVYKGHTAISAQAKAGAGQYTVAAEFGRINSKFEGYVVVFTSREGEWTLGRRPTPEAAKAVAQANYDKGQPLSSARARRKLFAL